jgi:putative redox protein
VAKRFPAGFPPVWRRAWAPLESRGSARHSFDDERSHVGRHLPSHGPGDAAFDPTGSVEFRQPSLTEEAPSGASFRRTTMQAIGTWKAGYETVLQDEHAHTVTVDLPVDEGGRSSGATALELAVLSLAGGITTTFALVAKKRRLEFHGLGIALEAERPRGSPTITRVHGTFRVRTKAPEAEVVTALRLTVKTCPVGILFERAGVPVEVAAVVVPSMHAT